MSTNPCFSVYTITQLCPIKYDPLGLADGTFYVPEGAGPVYFNRADVKAAINAPADKEWEFCTAEAVFIDGRDTSVVGGPGSQPVLPGVIDRTQNVILGHGSQDFVLISDGTLLTIQNLTFGGAMGFQERPVAPLYVPYHVNDGELQHLFPGVCLVEHFHTCDGHRHAADRHAYANFASCARQTSRPLQALASRARRTQSAA